MHTFLHLLLWRLMAKRLQEMYPVGTQVEIKMGEDVWLAGVVVQHEHPAVWVKTVNGRLWFVTNRQRIRKLKLNDET